MSRRSGRAPAVAAAACAVAVASLVFTGDLAAQAHEHHRPVAPTASTRAPEPAMIVLPDDHVPRVIVVSPDGELADLTAAVQVALPGDTIRVRPGHYRGSVTIDRPLTILGDVGAVLDAEGSGHVIEAVAEVTIRGLTIRGSGSRVDAEDAGVMVRGATARIIDNIFEDVLYGVYLKEASGSSVERNRIQGKPLSLSRRGDGIRLWQSPDSRVVANRIVGARDLVIYFSDRLEVRDNVVTDGRYGLHYMYSHDNVITGNRFERNDVGGFLMYSRGLELRSNVFADSRGATGIGIGLKDADDIRASGNMIVGNRTGLHLDNSPSDVVTSNRFEDNVIAMNDAGVRVLPSVRGNEFAGNEFVANLRPAEVPGGAVEGQADRNLWADNHWSDYAGFDGDEDARGDTPYVYARLTDQLLSKHPQLVSYSGSPALRVLDLLANFFPLLRPEPIVVDPTPRLATDVRASLRAATLDERAEADPVAYAGWSFVLALAVGAVAVGRRRGRLTR